MDELQNNLGSAAIVKAGYLQSLIEKINNTTVGDLNARIDSNDSELALINKKIEALAALFSLVFNSDGTLNSEAYSSHKHGYTDSTGENKTTTGVQ